MKKYILLFCWCWCCFCMSPLVEGVFAQQKCGFEWNFNKIQPNDSIKHIMDFESKINRILLKKQQLSRGDQLKPSSYLLLFT